MGVGVKTKSFICAAKKRWQRAKECKRENKRAEEEEEEEGGVGAGRRTKDEGRTGMSE